MANDRFSPLTGLRTGLAVLGIGWLVGACGGSGGGMADGSGGGGQGGTPDGGTPQMATELGAWNTLAAGTLDASDANGVLRAYYDSSGGQVTAGTPVQPAGMGTATWTGMWSGKIEVNSDAQAAQGLGLLGVSPNDLAALGGDATITAYFEGSGVEAALTYEDIGLDALGLGQVTSDRVSVTGGTFRPTKDHTVTIHAGPVTLEVSGDFEGEGAFAGTGAEGVAGYMGGDISVSYGLGPRGLGTFESVFYGTKDSN